MGDVKEAKMNFTFPENDLDMDIVLWNYKSKSREDGSYGVIYFCVGDNKITSLNGEF